MEAENAYTQRIEEMTSKLTEAKTLYSSVESDFQKAQSDLQVNQVILFIFIKFCSIRKGLIFQINKYKCTQLSKQRKSCDDRSLIKAWRVLYNEISQVQLFSSTALCVARNSFLITVRLTHDDIATC